MAAIGHGADAVYIGAPQFGARAMAGNSVTDIEHLAQYAHRFGAKVLVALNTILTNEELPLAEKISWQLYEAGVDALIVQDMGILSLQLPPIRLHASTQCDNRTPEKVRMLQQAGFKRVVLARELTLAQIAEIRAATTVELEAFVHGAVCVSYSGRCYLSQALCERSANRGTCAQMCRLPYDLLDSEEHVLLKHKHLLSLKDMNRSACLPELLAAGVTSLKIEGRLKDIDYVKNIVSYYRRQLDAVLQDKSDFCAASWGRTTFFFKPNPEKTFHRGNTDYFLHGRQLNMAQPNTPKSVGEQIGTIVRVESNSLLVDTEKALANSDGFCVADTGFMANRIETVSDGTKRIFPAQMPIIQAGSMLFRNFDHTFDNVLKHKTAERRLVLHINLAETESGFNLTLTQPDSACEITFQCTAEKIPAQKPEQAFQNIKTQLSKLGSTDFYAETVDLHLSQAWFLPAGQLNEWRRQAVEYLEKQMATKAAMRTPYEIKMTCGDAFSGQVIDYKGNAYNYLAERFYLQQGAVRVEPAFEKKSPADADLMTCKYCLKYELGWCPKQKPQKIVPEKLYLRTGSHLLQLHFDCAKCEMRITQTKDAKTAGFQ